MKRSARISAVIQANLILTVQGPVLVSCKLVVERDGTEWWRRVDDGRAGR